MQCLRIWFAICLFAISDVNNALASPVDILNVDNQTVGDLITAGSDQDDAVISERDNEVGYLRRADEKGANAYQHFESFHDKDGDAYGYEKHEAFGKSDKGESVNDGKDKNEGSHYTYVQELGDKPKYQKYQGSNDDPSKQNHYHYSYNSDDDDDEKKPNYSSNYKEEQQGGHDDSSEEDKEEEDDDEQDKDSKGTNEEKTTNFRYKIVSDDDEENDGQGDVTSKGNDNGYHFGHGDRNTKVDYSVKRSDYISADDDDDEDDDSEEEKDEADEDGGSEEEDDENEKNLKITDDDGGKAKDTKSYSTYTTYNSKQGDDEKDDNEKPIHFVRYESSHPIKNDQFSSKQNIEAEHDPEEYNESDESDEEHVNEDVELHQPAQPRPTKPVELVKEHRTQYNIENNHPESISTKAQVVIPPSEPIHIVHEQHAGYKVEENDGGKGSDDSGKGHAGSVTKHLYEIYVTHDTGKSNGHGGSGGDSKGSDDDGDDGKGKSENLVLEQPQSHHAEEAEGNDNGSYKVNINYGNKKGPSKNGEKSYRKRKGSLKRKKIIKPHKYEVKEYTNHGEETKQPTVATKKATLQPYSQPIVAGKESSPQHHSDSEDYSNGQQFVFASEADSDAYYW